LASTRGEVDGRFDPGAFRESGMMPVIRRIVTQTEEGVPTDQFLSGSGMNIEIEYDSPVPLRKPGFSMIFESSTGERLFSILTLSHHGFLSALPQSGTIRCQIPALPLTQGLYYLTFFVDSRQERIDSLERAIAFSIVGSDYFGTGFVPQEVHGRILVAANWDLPIATPALRLATESSG
jgi:Wzt C-terminal domain